MDEEKEGYWTPLEKRIRDYLLWPVTRPLGIIPYAANCITISGFFILFWAMIDLLYYHRPLERQVWFLTAAWLTDSFDGSTARNNRNVTAFGTATDHTRDYLLSFWMIFLSFYVTAQLSGSSPESDLIALIIYVILSLTILGMAGIILSVWLFRREKRRERPDEPTLAFIQRFFLEDLVTTVTARVHTFILALGDVFYLAGAIWQDIAFIRIGVTLLVVQLFILGFYLHEAHQQRYEDQTYKIRTALQKRIEMLEEAIKRFKEKIRD